MVYSGRVWLCTPAMFMNATWTSVTTAVVPHLIRCGRGPALVLVGVFWLLAIGNLAGCRSLSLETARRTARVVNFATGGTVGAKAIRKSNRFGPFAKMWAKPPQPSERTQQSLRRYALEDSFALGRKETLVKLQAYAARKPSLELQHALAEIAFQEGEWASKLGQTEKAQEMYATALVSSYQFLFDQQLDLARNAYDPQFRSISDIYNRSLEEVVRRLIKQEQFRVGQVVELRTLDRTVRFSIEHPGLWNEEDVERYEIARDYQATGVNNQYHTYGLGVPLIAVRKKLEQRNESEKYYPPGLTMAFTAFLQFNESLPPQSAPPRDLDAKLSLLNPLEQVYVQVNDRWIPLESDITTPMAYFLDDPLLNTNVFATFALLNADFAQDFQGIYMLEPYDPNKIPVVMIHGLWSSPVTWLQLFNDLRADPDIRQRYQFWFCLYSSGQPFWESARQVREDLEEVRQRLVASGADSTAMQDMVLVGHSMGGLIARQLTMSSGDSFWKILSDEPFEKLEGEPETLERLRETYFFEPLPNVSRVITIGTPHHGSRFANETTRWLSQKVITLPKTVTNEYMQLAKKNAAVFKNTKPFTISTSIDSLAPTNPFVQQMLEARTSPAVKYHNIIGRVESTSFWTEWLESKPTDGVVWVESATLQGVESETFVNAEHQKIHQHPRAILDVKRILYDHLIERGELDEQYRLVLPAGYTVELDR